MGHESTVVTIIPILAVLAIGVISPGPSFLMVARTAVAHSRGAGAASAIGMAAGATILAVAALFGLHTLLARLPAAYLGLKVVGGIYLLYLAYRTWRGAAAPLLVEAAPGDNGGGLLRHFWLAAATMLSNPKAAVQYGAIFAAVLPAAPSTSVLVVLPMAVFALEGSWYFVVALLLSAPGPRGAYLRVKARIDRTVGVVLGLLGIRLLLSSR